METNNDLNFNYNQEVKDITNIFQSDNLNFDHIQKIPQPEDIKANLYLHQLASVYEMEKLENDKKIITNNNMVLETNIGINADKTGYGKTLSMVTLIYRNKMKWDVMTTYTRSIINTKSEGRIKEIIVSKYPKLNVTLILASQSIIHQWYEEILKSPLTVCIVATKKNADTVWVSNFDIILVTPSMYNRLTERYHNIAWKRFIFDEPAHIKVPRMNPITAGFNWFITATPYAISEKHRHCNNSFMRRIIGGRDWYDFRSYTIPHLIIKNDENFINFSFKMPPNKHFYYKCHDQIYETVHDFVSKKVKLLISAGDICSAIRVLGGTHTNNIIELIKQRKTQEVDTLKATINVLKVRNRTEQIKKVKKSIERLENQILNLEKRYEKLLSGNCSICMEQIRKPVLEPNCQNIFCGVCLFQWLNTENTCPLCRQHIIKKELTYINNNDNKKSSHNPENKKLKTKVETVVSLIKDKPGGKFIIFSERDKTFVLIKNILAKNNISFAEIKGTIQQRQRRIRNFRKKDINVICLNTVYNGSGINLQEATDIIIYHEMSSSMLNQIIGRANRLGRTESLNIHHLQM